MISIQCLNADCRFAGRVGDEMAGSAFLCPRCQQRIVVPSSSGDGPDAADLEDERFDETLQVELVADRFSVAKELLRFFNRSVMRDNWLIGTEPLSGAATILVWSLVGSLVAAGVVTGFVLSPDFEDLDPERESIPLVFTVLLTVVCLIWGALVAKVPERQARRDADAALADFNRQQAEDREREQQASLVCPRCQERGHVKRSERTMSRGELEEWRAAGKFYGLEAPTSAEETSADRRRVAVFRCDTCGFEWAS